MHSHLSFPITIALVLTVCSLMLLGDRAFAQAEGGKGSEISLHLGNLFPNQIDGVTEILPVWGGRYAIGTELGMVELGGTNTHAKGVDFTTGTLSLRGDVPLAEGVNGMIYGGLDMIYYKPSNRTERLYETGVHVGTGLMMLVADTLWLRADLKFTGPPGTSMYLGAGVVFKAPGGN